MPRLRRSLLRALPLLLLSLPASAWNSAGHRLIAAIAWDQLDATTRSAVTRLLQEHPDYPRWCKKAEADDLPRAAFIEASTWPDDIRKDERFFTPGEEAPTATLPGFPDMQRHRDWHYVNRPLENPGQKAASGQLDRQLSTQADIVASKVHTMAERGYALPWLIHLVGDAHQPLHAVDKSGNDLTVIDPFNPRKSITTLHAYWDDLPGPPWLRGARLDKASKALVARYPKPGSSTPTQWLEESWQIAKDKAYPPDAENVPTINETFFAETRKIAQRRIAEAGYRLADLLRKLSSTQK